MWPVWMIEKENNYLSRSGLLLLLVVRWYRGIVFKKLCLTKKKLIHTYPVNIFLFGKKLLQSFWCVRLVLKCNYRKAGASKGHGIFMLRKDLCFVVKGRKMFSITLSNQATEAIVMSKLAWSKKRFHEGFFVALMTVGTLAICGRL
jgi:hypothetical protein